MHERELERGEGRHEGESKRDNEKERERAIDKRENKSIKGQALLGV